MMRQESQILKEIVLSLNGANCDFVSNFKLDSVSTKEKRVTSLDTDHNLEIQIQNNTDAKTYSIDFFIVIKSMKIEKMKNSFVMGKMLTGTYYNEILRMIKECLIVLKTQKDLI